MKKSFSLLVSVIFFTTYVLGQSTSDEIQRLQQLVNANEKLAKEAEIRAIRAEEQVKKMRYVAIANELAERSIELKEKELAALLSVQAYNFNTQNYGDSFNGKIYNALFDALKKYDLILIDSEEAKILLKSVSDKPIFSIELPNSQRKVVAEQNGNLKLVSEEGTTLRVLSGHNAQVDQIRFSHSGKLMATSGKDNTIRIWNLAQINVRPIVITESDQVSKLTFSPDGNHILYALGVKKVTIKQQPLEMKSMAADLCKVLTRNLSKEEWDSFVAADLSYESTCSKK